MKYSSLGNEISKNLSEQAVRRSECERTIVGSILLEPMQFPIVASIVVSDDFANTEFRGLYRLIELMHVNGEPVSSATVMFAAKRSGLMDVLGGPSEYGKIVSEVSNAKHSEFYAKELAKLSAASTAFNAAIELVKSVSLKSVDVVNAIEVFQCSINSTTTRLSKTATPVGDVILRIQESKGCTLVGRKISTGFNELDGLIGGLFAKHLVLLGGRFGKGKSCLASQLVSNAVFKSNKALIFSLEMSEEEFTQRILSNESGVSMNAWIRNLEIEERNLIKEFHSNQSKCKWWIDDRSRQTVQSIQSISQLYKIREGLDLVIIDNLQLISPHDLKIPREQQVKSITEELKRIAKDLDVCIVVLAQLDTEAGRSRPNSTNWATCKSIEGDADLAMMIHQPDDTKPNYELIVNKVRSTGERGTIDFVFNGEFQRFTESTTAKLLELQTDFPPRENARA